MRVIESVAGEVTRWAQTPMVLRNVSHVLRDVAPVTKIGQRVFVFRYQDVIDTLNADGDFGVTPVYATKMNRTSGAFFLGMEDGPRYRTESAFARKAFRSGDEERIIAITKAAARSLLRPLRGTGQMDFVTDFASQIPLALLRDYFGVPGPFPETTTRWLSSLFWELFLNFTEDSAVREAAETSGKEMRPYLLARIAQIRAQGGEESFLGRMVALREEPGSGIDDVGVARNIGGIVIGALSTQAKAMTLALQELLSRPDELEEARRAALSDDDEALSGYIFEALRFNPHNPLVVRYAMRPTVVARGTPHACEVDTGTQVFAMTISASFDAKGFADPRKFDPDRSFEDYLHFGYGLHRCFGARVVKLVLTAALKQILLLQDLRPVVRSGPMVSYRGPFPSSFKLRFQKTH